MILISLSLSWITAISTTPLLCAWLLKSGHARQRRRRPLCRQVVPGLPRDRGAGNQASLGHPGGSSAAVLPGTDRLWLDQERVLPGFQHPAVLCRRVGTGGHRYPQDAGGRPAGQPIPATTGRRGADLGGDRRPAPALYPGLRRQGTLPRLRADHRPDRKPRADRAGLGAATRFMRRSCPGPTRSSSHCGLVPVATPRSRRAFPGPIRRCCAACRSRRRPSCGPTPMPPMYATTGARR